MNDLNRMIESSLRDADGDSPELSVEPGYFKQALGLFTGRMAWVHWLMMVMQAVMFIAGVWCAVKFFQAEEVMTALRWGLPAVVLFSWSMLIKAMLLPPMETNRILMEIKRMELRIERLRAERQ